MKKLIAALWKRDAFRYVFFGGCTTLVNILSFWLLRHLTPLNITVSNVISIFLAIVFAFFVNAGYVFHSKSNGFKEKFGEFLKFFSGRLTTMAIEVGGVWLLAEALRFNEFFAKIVTQFIVLVLNFFISKYFVFRQKEQENDYGTDHS